MFARFTSMGIRCVCTALAVFSVLLLGCARKLQIEIPADFHGHIHITCAGLITERSSKLVASTGEVIAATCPARQSDVVVLRAGAAAPVETAVTWATTGDGLVREIQFNVK